MQINQRHKVIVKRSISKGDNLKLDFECSNLLEYSSYIQEFI